ncbi:MAG: hypothetical protein WC359_15255, partial [Dehalococcoidia bacterium]
MAQLGDGGQHELYEHNHGSQFVRPTGAVPIVLTAGAAWTLGDFSADIIAAADITNPFDLHWAELSGPDTNASYEIVLYYGAADTEYCRCAFTRTGVFTSSITVPLQGPIIPAGSRIRAKLMSDQAGVTVGIT